MKFGYARISTKDQNIDSQLDALKTAGCDEIFYDIVSGAKKERAELNKLLEHLREGDTIIICKLDRLGRSLHHLVNLIDDLNKKNIGLVSLNDPIDTTTSQGKLIFNIFASIAEFERELIRERTNAGLASARARGKLGGRRPGLSSESQNLAASAETLYKEEKLSTRDICKQLSISPPTLYKYLRYRNVPISSYNRKKRVQ